MNIHPRSKARSDLFSLLLCIYLKGGLGGLSSTDSEVWQYLCRVVKKHKHIKHTYYISITIIVLVLPLSCGCVLLLVARYTAVQCDSAPCNMTQCDVIPDDMIPLRTNRLPYNVTRKETILYNIYMILQPIYKCIVHFKANLFQTSLRCRGIACNCLTLWRLQRK